MRGSTPLRGAAIASVMCSAIIVVVWSQGLPPWELGPGDYHLSLIAHRGSRAGAEVDGRLALRPTSDADTSPRNGQRAAGPPDIRNAPLYGWTDISLAGVGVPICEDGPAPPAWSQDPVFPGVLALKLDPDMSLEARVPYRKDALILVTGTGTNIRDGKPRLDGCGIGLFVQDRGWRCLRGEWTAWGLEADGAGTFSLCL